MESGYALMQKKSRGDPTRTGDHLVPNQVRYQLRYTPNARTLPKAGAKVALLFGITKFSRIFFINRKFIAKISFISD